MASIGWRDFSHTHKNKVGAALYLIKADGITLRNMQFIKQLIFILLAVTVTGSIKAQTVFKTPSGQKYHLASCRMVRNVSQEITVAEANKMDLEPCKICNPQNIYNGAPPPHKAQGQNSTAQCIGYTKAGNRCKHMTSIANGYCYQHQPK